MAGITTHVLDTVAGKPGTGMRIDFSILDGQTWRLVKSVYANADGRTDEMILAPESTKVGQYELLFHVGDYFRTQGATLARSAVSRRRCRCASPSPTPRSTIMFRCWSPRSGCATYRGS